MRASRCFVAAFICAASSTASAQSVRLTLEEALGRARSQTPAALVAQARVEESRARLVGAQVRFRENPSIEAFVGPRSTDRGTSADLDVGFSQFFETGGQRAVRIAGAEAAVSAESAAGEDIRRHALEAVALAFFQTTFAEERVRSLAASELTAGDVFRVATRRYEAGDIPVLDVNLARSAVARVRSARIASEADQTLAGAELARLIGLPAGTAVMTDGALESDRSADLSRLLAALENRADLRALKSSIAEAEADTQLGLSLKRPDLGFSARAKREGGDCAVIGGLTIVLPAFNNGQELRAAGQARAARLRLDETTRTAAATEVQALYQAYVTRRAAATALEQEALPSAAENEQLSQRSFEEGQLSLADLLVVRRELVEARLEYLERLRDAAETAITRDAAAGVLQ